MWGAGQEEDENPADQSAHIILKVKGLDGNEVFIRIERSTQLKKLMNAYCDSQSVDFNSFGFIFAGRILRGEQTPDELGMVDGDEILAMLRLFCKVCSEDPRLKLQRKDSQQAMLNKLSGTVRPQSENTESLKPKPVAQSAKSVAQSAKPVQKNDIPTIEAKISVLRKLSAPTTSGKQSQQKVVQASVEGLLKSLGLEKYLVTFRAEEVDMTALRHLTDEDLKSLGIPMGPRKKILLAVNSKTKNKGKRCKLLDVIRVLTVLLLFSVLFVHGITSSCRITYFRQIH